MRRGESKGASKNCKCTLIFDIRYAYIIVEGVLGYELRSSNAKAPSRGTPRSAGLDLYFAEYVVISAWSQHAVTTGVRVSLPRGTYSRVTSRSGLALKNNIHVMASTIDPDYDGEIKVLLLNTSAVSYAIATRQRIAQLICKKIIIPEVKRLDCPPPPPSPLSTTSTSIKAVRSDNGFGSTGMF